MEPLHLYVGNRNYSSWSFRPWLAMRHAGITFDVTVIPLAFDGTSGPGERNAEIRKISPSGRVPVLTHGKIVVWESLAILEYVNDVFPECRLWPDYIGERGMARAVSHEMHAGFAALRAEAPMNMRRTPSRIDLSEAARRDVARIEELWLDCRGRYGDTGPFLFGDFSIADAMYAPVVNRFHVYEIPVTPISRAYMDTVRALPAWNEWEAQAHAEPWVIEEEEV